MNHVLRRDKCGCAGGVEKLATFGSKRAHVFECHRGVGFVDRVECAIVADVLFGDERDATPFGRRERKSTGVRYEFLVGDIIILV